MGVIDKIDRWILCSVMYLLHPFLQRMNVDIIGLFDITKKSFLIWVHKLIYTVLWYIIQTRLLICASKVVFHARTFELFQVANYKPKCWEHILVCSLTMLIWWGIIQLISWFLNLNFFSSSLYYHPHAHKEVKKNGEINAIKRCPSTFSFSSLCICCNPH